MHCRVGLKAAAGDGVQLPTATKNLGEVMLRNWQVAAAVLQLSRAVVQGCSHDTTACSGAAHTPLLMVTVLRSCQAAELQDCITGLTEGSLVRQPPAVLYAGSGDRC